MPEIVWLNAEFEPCSQEEAVLVKVRHPDGTIVFARPKRALSNAAWKDPRDPFGTAPKDPDFESKHPRDRKGEFTDKHGQKRVTTQSGEKVSKMELAAKHHKAVGSDKIRLSKESEVAVAAAIGGVTLDDFDAFDVQHPNFWMEVKTFIDNKNGKITIHGHEDKDAIGAMNRKILKSQDTRLPIVTVVHDIRDGKDEWHVRAGIGSFYLHTMEKLPDLAALKTWLHTQENRDAAREFFTSSIQPRRVAFRFGFTFKQARAYNQINHQYADDHTEQEFKVFVKKHGAEALKTQRALGKCDADGFAIDKKGKRIK